MVSTKTHALTQLIHHRGLFHEDIAKLLDVNIPEFRAKIVHKQWSASDFKIMSRKLKVDSTQILGIVYDKKDVLAKVVKP